MTWWKRHKNKIFGGAVVLAVLALAFWWGGDAPGLHGWTVGGETTSEDRSAPDISQETPPESPSENELPAAAPDESAPTEGEKTPDAVQPETEPEPVPETKPEQSAVSAQPPAATEPDPAPEEEPDEEEPLTCTISISCAAILNHMDWLAEGKESLVPEDGWLLTPYTDVFYEGESVFNVLRRVCKQQKIHLEFENTPLYDSAYIEGIGNLYEFDCGEQSGWMYSVNGQFPNYGCSQYTVQDGDVICWVYTCDMGADAGGDGQLRR
jgi:hypothetical protein